MKKNHAFFPWLVLFSLLLCRPALAQNAPDGSYRQSCKNAVVEYGTILKAECKTAKGGWTKTSLEDFKNCDIDIVSHNGQLMCRAKAPAAPPGSYRQTCDHIVAKGDVVAARCMAGTDWKAATIDLKQKRCGGGLANKNGNLACE